MPSAFSATRWILFGSIGFRVVSLGGQMLILRIVDPDAFGIYRAIVMIHLTALTLLPMGFDALVVREKPFRARYVVALTQMLALLGGFVVMGSLLLAALPVPGVDSFSARWMNVPGTIAPFLFMSPIFAVQAMKLSIRSLLSADLHFRTISIGEFGNGVITWIGGAAAVIMWPTAWALLAAYLVGECFECWWMYRREPFRPAEILPPGRWSVLRRLFVRHRRFCTVNMSDQTLNNVAALLPGVLFVVLISPEANSQFSVAVQLLILPTMLLTGALWRVAFPSISGVSESELHRRCLSIVSGSAAFIAPVVLWFACFSPLTVSILAGEQYMATTPILVRWMALYMVMVAIYAPISSLDIVRDKPEVGLCWNAIYAAMRMAIICVVAPHGIVYTMMVLSILSATMWMVWVATLGWLLRAPWRIYVWSVARFIPAWALLVAGLIACVLMLGDATVIGALASAIPLLIYAAVVFKFYPEQGRLLMKLARR